MGAPRAMNHALVRSSGADKRSRPPQLDAQTRASTTPPHQPSLTLPCTAARLEEPDIDTEETRNYKNPEAFSLKKKEKKKR